MRRLISLRLLRRMAAAATFALAAAALFEAWHWKQATTLNALLEAGVAEAPAESAAAELHLAHALHLAAREDVDGALARLTALQSHPALGTAARIDAANLLLRQALALQGSDREGAALAMTELAKEKYREVLRAEPQAWDARYNLERALRVVPDPELDDEPGAPARQAERAATTMRGYTPGLP